MAGIFSPDEVHKLVGQFTAECRKELLKAGKFSDKRMTRVDFKALHECVRKKFREEIMKRIQGLA